MHVCIYVLHVHNVCRGVCVCYIGAEGGRNISPMRPPRWEMLGKRCEGVPTKLSGAVHNSCCCSCCSCSRWSLFLCPALGPIQHPFLSLGVKLSNN